MVVVELHRCGMAERKRLANPDYCEDMLFFPVGYYGRGLPGGAAFEVQSSEPCGECGVILRVYAQWQDRKVIDFGSRSKG
jgi:hypothetical protein